MHINAQESDEAVEEVIVTGSYIKGSATDGASPVEIISRDTIENLGATTVADIIRNMAINTISETVFFCPHSFDYCFITLMIKKLKMLFLHN